MRHRKLVYAAYIPALLLVDGCALHESAAWAVDEEPAPAARPQKESTRRSAKERSVILDAQRAPAKDSVVTKTPRVGSPPPVFDDSTIPVSDAGEPLDDNEIVRAIHELGQRQLAAAEQLQRRATDPRLRRFGGEVETAYRHSEQRTERLSRNTELQPKDSPTAAVLRDETRRDAQRVALSTGPDLDKAMIDQQVDLQRKARRLVEDRMLPVVEDEQLRSLLQQLQPVVNRQLHQAQALQHELYAAPKMKESTKTKE